MQTYLELSDISMEFNTSGQSFRALDGVNLKIGKGEFVTLTGHSGCGKSTVLNILAGLQQAIEGGVILQGREVTGPNPDRAVVFQNHALMPWLTVHENVALGVRQVFRGQKNRREMREWTMHHLELVQMAHAAGKYPSEISGGMKQRVGIARCLAMQPRVLLMDEPFGALDALTRAHLQDALMEIHASLEATVIMITHDVDEAVLLSDRVVMMNNGPAADIGRVLPVTLPRPRNRLALAQNETFIGLRKEVLQFLYEKQTDPQEPANAETGSRPARRSLFNVIGNRKRHAA